MAKLIFTSRYLRDVPAPRIEHYVRYIGTREGVEKMAGGRDNLPATKNQKQYIEEMVRKIPEARELLEYMDFSEHPTMGNASELISCALERYVDFSGSMENYVDYIANRPRVERVGEHGLFTDAGKPVMLRQVQKEAAEHKGVIWTHVISLKREDAARLGYDRAEQWMALLWSKRAMLCKHMKIDSADLRWYAAFHNEGHHPHVHLMVYSARDNDGYLTKMSIEAMRSELAHDIFRQDFANIYDKQNQARTEMKEESADVIKQLMEEMKSGMVKNMELEKMLLALSGKLSHTKGKKVYGYLKRDVKNLVDRIIDEIAEDERVDALYKEWNKWQGEIRKFYENSPEKQVPLSQCAAFKSLKNLIISEAMQISHDVRSPEWIQGEAVEQDFPEEGMQPENGQEEAELYRKDKLPNVGKVFVRWTKKYKLAKQYLYGSDEIRQDFSKAMGIFFKEAGSGNALAMYELAWMYEKGMGCEKEEAVAQEWYGKALNGFLKVSETAKEKWLPYMWYRIGKMYAAGQGTEKNYEEAAAWFERAVEKKHNFAQYALAGQYLNGQGVEKDERKALQLYECAKKQGNPYAGYEAGKMYRDGIGTEADEERAQKCFKSAFYGFSALERESHEDNLQYRLGWMFHTGTGIERDDGMAESYWVKAEKTGNIRARYSLAMMWLENGTGDTEKALGWLEELAESGNDAAQYALGKVYLQGKGVPEDKERAVEYLKLSAEQGNKYALFLLEYLEPVREPSVFFATVRLMAGLQKIFQEEFRKENRTGRYHIDRKRRKKLTERRRAQGHRTDDHEPEQQIEG